MFVQSAAASALLNLSNQSGAALSLVCHAHQGHEQVVRAYADAAQWDGRRRFAIGYSYNQFRQINAGNHGVHRFADAWIALDIFRPAALTLVEVINEERTVPAEVMANAGHVLTHDRMVRAGASRRHAADTKSASLKTMDADHFALVKDGLHGGEHAASGLLGERFTPISE